MEGFFEKREAELRMDDLGYVIQSEVEKNDRDMVNHPSHYADKQIEVIDYIRDTLTKEGFTEYCGGNVLKYVSRWRHKGGVEDLKKASVYLNWMIESAEKEDSL